ncbi:unnamed protein product [Candida verbasci]|uniref:Uncharacterized protein n=1 Tax=Candida verbasci TaxID=1227364 RepID=A0A9W4XFD5_9ASCO|nr:unnamed protein product [Candida verbasci]
MSTKISTSNPIPTPSPPPSQSTTTSNTSTDSTIPKNLDINSSSTAIYKPIPTKPIIDHNIKSSSLTNLSDYTKSYKRSSSSSNDLIYERDRFRARIKSFNQDSECECCDDISFKTTKLNIINRNILDSSSAFHKSLPTYFAKETSNLQLPMKEINLKQLNLIFDYYFNSRLPETNDMFPWLHGLHKDNFAQKSFFLMQQQQRQQHLQNNNTSNYDVFSDYSLSKPNNVKFLMCVTDETLPINLRNTVKLSEILQKIDVSRLEIKNIIKEMFYTLHSNNSELIDLLTLDCIKLNVLPKFLNLDPDRGISLRNFHIQVAKLSTCSDFIIYGEDYNKIESMARILYLAQINEANFEKSSEITTNTNFNIYILKDNLNHLYQPVQLSSILPLKNYFQFCKIDLNNLNYKSDSNLIWENNFQINEKIETTRMSTATKIYKNVWIGNFWDHQIIMHYILNDKEVVPIEGNNLIDLYNDYKNSILLTTMTSNYMDYLPTPKANWRLLIQCHSDASFPNLSFLKTLLFKYTISSRESSSQFHHLEFPPSGSIGIGDCKQENLESIINTCKLIYLYSSSNSTKDLSCLIYCSDGYTENSLLMIFYLIYSLNISLEEALLKIHLEYGRPFYLFNSDVIILKKLEPLLQKFSPQSSNSQIEWSNLEELSSQEINEILLGPPKKQLDNTKFGYIDNESSSESSESDSENELITEIDWVKEVEGSLPSKVLPYLYLGSLKHASCLPLLNKIGIKKIISVGENLFWLNGYKFKKFNEISIENYSENIDLIHIKPKKLSNYHNSTVTTIMKVMNLEDDGIDELLKQLPKILQFINDEYISSNGDTKILVHCRVGVSRSATVVIAEIMKRLKINLFKAYLYVRVRRLNIIIQPNLRFMYELFKWEEEEKLKLQSNNNNQQYLREIDWFIMCREIMKLNIPYLNN